MPELPEVETIRLGLEPHLLNQQITEAVCHRPGLRYPFATDFTDRLKGGRIIGVHRRAKYLLCHVQKQAGVDIWLSHLGMTGRFQIVLPTEKDLSRAKHDHMHIALGNGIEIRYNDSRRFGFMKIFSEKELASDPHLTKLGWEPLGNEINADQLWQKIQKSDRSLKQILMDQSLIAGLGNIYVSEALYRSGLHPERTGRQVSLAEIDLLLSKIRETLRAALAAGGSSLKDFQQVSGESGYFQVQFQVYGRQGEACVTTGCQGVVEKRTHQGRATYFCPQCQSLSKTSCTIEPQ